jgi:hypothetical protein
MPDRTTNAAGRAAELTIREAFAGWLATLPGLAGAGLYWEQPSQLALYPCLVLRIPDRTFGHNLAGADGTSRATVEVTTLALRQADCIGMAEAVRDHLHGFRGTQSGVGILRLLLEDEADDATAPPDGSDRWIYQVTLEYRCDHRLPMPTDVTQSNT